MKVISKKSRGKKGKLVRSVRSDVSPRKQVKKEDLNGYRILSKMQAGTSWQGLRL